MISPSSLRRQAEKPERSMTIILPYPPSVNNLYMTVGRRRVLTKRGRQYKDTAAKLAYRAGFKRLAGDVLVKLEVYRPRRCGDVDGYAKIILDSLKGIAWTDDAQVKRIEAERFEDRDNPRAEVTIEEFSTLPASAKTAGGRG